MDRNKDSALISVLTAAGRSKREVKPTDGALRALVDLAWSAQFQVEDRQDVKSRARKILTEQEGRP